MFDGCKKDTGWEGVEMTKEELVKAAVGAMAKAYAPYSGFQVGAALLCEDGTVYTGCNIENAGFSATVCAERTAFFKAVSDGKMHFSAIAICGGKNGILSGDILPPCGICRQVMREFCSDDFLIHMPYDQGIKTHTLAELLPLSFAPESIR